MQYLTIRIETGWESPRRAAARHPPADTPACTRSQERGVTLSLSLYLHLSFLS